ncbi:GPI inositol deacylase [Malassezia sp. CBS 17886]|nr:GPI inositol deacylase [Malassezia sp. CBS 17886]
MVAAGARVVVVAAVALGVLLYAVTAFRALPGLLDARRGCRMSRMTPNYVSHDEALRAFSASSRAVMRKYSLLEYREGSPEAPRMVLEDRTLHASAALFIPGNAGSYGQVRSMASSGSLQYWDARGRPRSEWESAPGPVIWYTLDFNEDFSALHGATVEEQAYFVNEALAYLQSVYPSPDNGAYREGERASTVPLVGHSMGGIVARLALRLGNHPRGSVDTVVSLSTPHAFPPLPLDRSMERTYTLINSALPAGDTEPLLLSVAGGVLDTQLSSDAASLALADVHEPLARLSTFTASVASLWSPVDHLAVVWCDQLRFRIAKGLLLDYAYFGHIAETRRRPGVRAERRELWRRVLGVALDAAGDADVAAALIPSSPTALALHDTTPTYMWDTLGDPSGQRGDPGIFDFKANTELYQTLAPPGPRHRYDGTADARDEELAFELLTNLCAGKNALAGLPVPQNVEVVVLLCTRAPSPGAPTQMSRAACRAVLPSAFESLPASPRPPAHVFPDPALMYDVPSASFRRLHLPAAFLRANDVQWIRVEAQDSRGAYVDYLHNNTIVHAGWLENRPLPLAGAPGWLTARTWTLPGASLDDLLSTQMEHAPLWEWRLPDVDSALLAYAVELSPAACAARLGTPPAFSAPILRLSSLATGDTRTFPSLDVSAPLRAVVALHGAAPFMPAPRGARRGTLVQLWVPDDFRDTQWSATYSAECPLPFDKIRLAVHWRASAGLLVLRYRLVFATWPLGVLALAHALAPAQRPRHALLALLTARAFPLLLASPAAVHILGALARSHTVGVGLSSRAFLWLGPALMLIAYVAALAIASVCDAALLAVHLAMRVHRTAAPPLERAHALPTPAALVAYMRATPRRPLLVGAAALLWVILPTQVFLAGAAVAHFVLAAQLLGSARAGGAADTGVRAAGESAVSALRTTALVDNVWYALFAFLVLPMQFPHILTWARNLSAGLGAGVAHTNHSVLLTAALLAMGALLSGPCVFPKPDCAWAASGSRVVYGTWFVLAVVYGLRYAFVMYDWFLVVVAWEVEGRPFFVLEDDDVPMGPIAHRLEYLDTVDAYVRAQERVQAAMSAGFAQLTRAKMTLDGGLFGVRVSQDMYDAKMRALVHVDARDAESGMRLAHGGRAQTQEVGDDAALEGGVATDAGLRRRAMRRAESGGRVHAGDASPARPGGETGAHAASGALPTAPLAQFSGLPPRSLQCAQRHFVRALHALVPAAADEVVLALQGRLVHLEGHIRTARAVT